MITYWLIKHLDPDWKLAHKMWSVRLAVFWAVIAGAWTALPAFQSYVHPVVFGLLCVGMSLLILVGRLTKQKGFPDV